MRDFVNKIRQPSHRLYIGFEAAYYAVRSSSVHWAYCMAFLYAERTPHTRDVPVRCRLIGTRAPDVSRMHDTCSSVLVRWAYPLDKSWIFYLFYLKTSKINIICIRAPFLTFFISMRR